MLTEMLEAIGVHLMISFEHFLCTLIVSHSIVRQSDLKRERQRQRSREREREIGRERERDRRLTTNLTADDLGVREYLLECAEHKQSKVSFLLLQEHLDGE
jgi:hypothetical protein